MGIALKTIKTASVDRGKRRRSLTFNLAKLLKVNHSIDARERNVLECIITRPGIGTPHSSLVTSHW